jgi:hypothetical protein
VIPLALDASGATREINPFPLRIDRDALSIHVDHATDQSAHSTWILGGYWGSTADCVKAQQRFAVRGTGRLSLQHCEGQSWWLCAPEFYRRRIGVRTCQAALSSALLQLRHAKSLEHTRSTPPDPLHSARSR